jgi:hypothetical protein
MLIRVHGGANAATVSDQIPLRFVARVTSCLNMMNLQLSSSSI